MNKFLLTSESVSKGHPDKVCDQISDSILDECLKQDENSLVACEVAAFNNTIIVGGEISTRAIINFENIIREKIKEIGYTSEDYGIDYRKIEIIIRVNKQSQEIQNAVINNDEIGAGDQGIMFGYATNETQSYLPLGLDISNKLLMKHNNYMKENENILPDAKSQVTIEYDSDEKPLRIDTILISTQHTKKLTNQDLYNVVMDNIVNPTLENYKDYNKGNIKIIINPSGSFHIGGPKGDAGLTGRKIIVDTYGGAARHGGGAFSGKDATKVDRSAAYMSRYLAKNIVASGICNRCEIQLSYGIGIAKPISIKINTDNGIYDDKIINIIKNNFTLTPKEIINKLDLRKPIYSLTSTYGHFGKEYLPWEKLDIKDLFSKSLI